MSAATSPAGAPADHTHWCPGGCHTRVPNRYFACGNCWARLPYPLQRDIQTHYRRDEAEHAKAMVAAKAWYDTNPLPQPDQPGPPKIALQLQDLADMLNGEGRHAEHTQRQLGRCVVCSCGTRVQGRLP